jgi:hypothetical protein
MGRCGHEHLVMVAAGGAGETGSPTRQIQMRLVRNTGEEKPLPGKKAGRAGCTSNGVQQGKGGENKAVSNVFLHIP